MSKDKARERLGGRQRDRWSERWSDEPIDRRTSEPDIIDKVTILTIMMSKD